MIVYLTRHGQPLLRDTEDADPEYPRHDPPLTALGRLQARALGRQLRDHDFCGRIYASPYRRTVQTAQLLAEVLGACLIPEPALREIVKSEQQMAEFQGLDAAALRAEFPQLCPDASLHSPWWTTAVETDDQVLARVTPFLEELTVNSDEDVLLVGHGASVEAITRWFLARSADQPDGLPISWHCALTAFRIAERCELLLMRDTSHLEDDQITSNARRKADADASSESRP